MKEELIVAYYCEKPIKNSEIFKKNVTNKFGITDTRLLSSIYTKTINYQIKKYGEPLHYYCKELSSYEKNKAYKAAKQRKYYRKSKRA